MVQTNLAKWFVEEWHVEEGRDVALRGRSEEY